MNVTEQSVTLSSYASGAILSTRRKADNGHLKGKLSETRHEFVTGDTPTVTAVCGFRLAGRISTDA